MSPSRSRRAIALALPVIVPVAMRATFVAARRRLGDRWGYVCGFAAYWATCAAASLALLGPRWWVPSLGSDSRRSGLRAADAALLLWPPAGAVSTRLVPGLREADRTMVATSAAVALVNATVEEALWRGVYVAYWPDDPWLGVVWPALGFGAWHAAPQVIHPSPMGTVRYVAAATALGMSWGLVAWRSRSLGAVLASHLVTDASGVRNARYFLPA